MICKILGLFVKTLTADDKYSLFHRDNLLQRLQMQLSQKQNSFLAFCLHISENYIQFWTFSEERWPSYLTDFWTNGLRKTMLEKCLKSPVSEAPLTSNMVNGPNIVETWTTAPLPYLSLLVICKTLGLFVNTLTADNKYSLPNSDNLLQHLERQLSQKQKYTFPISCCILEI